MSTVEKALQDFLIEACTYDQLLAALRAKAWEYKDYQRRLELATRTYMANATRYPGRRPPQGEGLRGFAVSYGVRFEDLRRRVEKYSGSQV